MKTVFFTQDAEIITLGGDQDSHVSDKYDEIISFVGAGPAVLILDYDLNKKEADLGCKQYSDNDSVHCIVVGDKFSPKELKKLQGKDDAASGYFSKPLDVSTFNEIIEDFELIVGTVEDVELEYQDEETSPTQVTEEESTLPESDNIPGELAGADGEAISFDEADDGITFDMGEESGGEDVTDPSRTDVNLSEEEDVDIDVAEEDSSDEDGMEFDLGADPEVGETEGVSIEEEEAAGEDGMEFDIGGEDTSEVSEVASDEVGLSLGEDDSFGELELSKKRVEEEIDEEDGMELSSNQDNTGEFDTTATELNAPVGTSDLTRPTSEANASEEVKLLSDEDKAAIARIEKIDYTYDENEMVKSQITIRHMREERQSLLKEIDQLKISEKQKAQDSLTLRAELDETKIEVSILKKRRSEDMENIKYQLRLSEEKKKIFEEKLKHYQGEFAKLDKKVRVDINQVRQKEKDLENKLELTVMDAESQIKSRDFKIADLKRKIDSLEFNMENVSINEQKVKEDKIRLEERIAKIMSTLRNSISLIEDDLDFDDEALLERLNKL